MNKKLIIISVSSILALLLISVGIYFLANQNTNKPVLKNNTGESDTSKNTGSKDINYSVEEGIEDVAGIAKLAVESYTQQDISESTTSRNKRLNTYFTSDSPVYGYGQQDINSSVNKSSAKVTSIKSCEEQEGENQCLLVDTDVTLYSNKLTNTTTRTYWLTLKTESGKPTLVFDIGEL